ncbi:MAG TPA: T9SS type A sorting domain-containing protein [Puia sp.]|jgi:hypothetical protein
MQPIFTPHRYLSLICLFFLSFASGAWGQAATGQNRLPKGVSSGWYSQAVAKIEDREYFINPLDHSGTYGAINHAQHLGYCFTDEGYGVRSFNEDGSTKNTWQTRFLLTGIGRNGRLCRQPLLGTSRTGDHSLQYDHKEYAVLYDNEKPGMEQSFLLKERPAGAGPLQIVLGLQGDLDARIGSAGELLLFTAGHPQDLRLVYDQLHVWDKNKRKISAHMSLGSNRRLILTVDDRAAVYPVTVDPFAHGPSQAFSVQNILNSGVADVTAHVLYGFSVSGAGDVNGDGFDDIIMGAPTFAVISVITGGNITLNTTIAVTGAAFIYFGVSGSAPLTSPSTVLQPGVLAQGALFGYSVCTVGNAGGTITNKGVAVGAPGDQVPLVFSGIPLTVAIGKVYVYTNAANFTGDVNTTTTPDAVLTLKANDFASGSAAPNRNPLYGFSIADAGDVDGNGFDDIIVGGPMYNDATAFGRVDIYNGGASGVSLTPITKITGAAAGEYLGFSVAPAGKVNGDAFADVIIGAPGGIISGGIIQGHAYIFHGVSGGITSTRDNQATGTVGTTLTAPASLLTGTLFGFSVSTAGDVDNDLIDDVIVGAPLSPNGTGVNGKAYVFYGSNNAAGVGSGSARPASTLTSPRAAAGANLLFGFSVGRAGNVTGDASGDVLVGEPGSLAISNPIVNTLLSTLGLTSTATQFSGQAYVFAGNSGSGVSASPILTINDASTPNLLGTSVHYAGDVDGDGFADFLVGEPSGILDLGFDLGSIQPIPGVTLNGTLSVGSNKGLIPSGSIGNSLLFFGFNGTLPITMLSFTGQAEKGNVLLNWATAQEENSDYFEVERSTDNMNFAPIGKVTAAHNSAQTTNYSYTDLSPAAGNNYYRLKMVDLDGSSVYSKIVVVNFSTAAGSVIATYPNPAHGSFRILFRNMQTGRYQMELLDPIGQTIQSKVIEVSDPANYNETVDLDPGLAQGTYLVRVVDQQQHAFITRIVVR